MRIATDATDFPQVKNYAYDGVLDYGLKDLAKYGITTSVDARVFWKEKMDVAWENLKTDNKLTARVVQSLWAYPEEDRHAADCRPQGQI